MTQTIKSEITALYHATFLTILQYTLKSCMHKLMQKLFAISLHGNQKGQLNQAHIFYSIARNIYSRYEGDEGVGVRTPWCCGAERCHVREDAQEGRGLPIHSAKPDHSAICGVGDGRPGASWERCVHSPCARFHSHGWSQAVWNIPEHDRSSPQTGTGNLEGRILQRIFLRQYIFNGQLKCPAV